MRISIDGNIGAKKSTILKALGVPVIVEPVDTWSLYLHKFYVDPVRWGFCFNLKVLTSFANYDKNSICERSPYSCRYVFTQLQFEEKKMDMLEFNTFDEVYKQIGWKPDVLIYLKTDPKKCLERIKIRDRSSERNIELDYLQQLHDKYESLDHTNRYVIDGEQENDVILQQINKIIQNIREIQLTQFPVSK
jgi:deoxyadenosine/deoxycytidine kinase